MNTYRLLYMRSAQYALWLMSLKEDDWPVSVRTGPSMCRDIFEWLDEQGIAYQISTPLVQQNPLEVEVRVSIPDDQEAMIFKLKWSDWIIEGAS